MRCISREPRGNLGGAFTPTTYHQAKGSDGAQKMQPCPSLAVIVPEILESAGESVAIPLAFLDSTGRRSSLTYLGYKLHGVFREGNIILTHTHKKPTNPDLHFIIDNCSLGIIHLTSCRINHPQVASPFRGAYSPALNGKEHTQPA